MSRFLIKTTETYRIDTVEEVEAFHTELKENGNFELAAFSYAIKQIKEKKEVVGEYCLAKVVKIFNDEKDPVNTITINYDNE